MDICAGSREVASFLGGAGAAVRITLYTPEIQVDAPELDLAPGFHVSFRSPGRFGVACEGVGRPGWGCAATACLLDTLFAWSAPRGRGLARARQGCLRRVPRMDIADGPLGGGVAESVQRVRGWAQARSDAAVSAALEVWALA